jgi:hypothetical protein
VALPQGRRDCVLRTFRVFLEAIRRLVNVVLLAALFLLNGKLLFPQEAHSFLLRLGGKLGLKTERDSPYLLLRGLRNLLTCFATLALLKQAGLLEGLLELLDTL